MDGFFGSLYIQFIGATIIWLYRKFLEKVFKKQKVTFDEILGKKEDDNYKRLDHSGRNLALGLMFILIILLSIKFAPRILYLLSN